ncbi:sigma-70 factor domain-containing protein [Rhodococcus sp. 3Y1]
MGRTALLTAADEVELAKRIEAGCTPATSLPRKAPDSRQEEGSRNDRSRGTVGT